MNRKTLVNLERAAANALEDYRGDGTIIPVQAGDLAELIRVMRELYAGLGDKNKPRRRALMIDHQELLGVDTPKKGCYNEVE